MTEKVMSIDDGINNFGFSGLSLEQVNKLPKWLLENLEKNKSALARLIEQEKDRARLEELDKISHVQYPIMAMVGEEAAAYMNHVNRRKIELEQRIAAGEEEG